MNHELELKLQAWMDGELPLQEADEVARLIERDPQARALLTELRNTRTALVGSEPERVLPESREFYWSKIARAIEQQEQPRTEPTPQSPWWLRLRRLWLPAGAVAAMVLAGLMVGRPPQGEGLSFELDNLVADSDTFTFTDEENETTLIWFSYPAENEFTTPSDPGIL